MVCKVVVCSGCYKIDWLCMDWKVLDYEHKFGYKFMVGVEI